MAWVATGVGVVTAGVGMYQGYKQNKAGKEALKNAQNPEYTIPKELLDNLSDAEKQKIEGLPPEMKRQAVQNIERSAAGVAKDFTDRKAGLVGVQASMSDQNNAYSNLVSMDAAALQESKNRRLSDIKSARLGIADAKDTAMGIGNANRAAAIESAQGNIAAGTQNMFGALTTLGTTAIGAAGAKGRRPGSGGRNVNENGSTTPLYN